MSAANWYIGGDDQGAFAPYSPATFKGSWDILPTAADRLLSPYKVGSIEDLQRAETSATSPLRVCIWRAISITLAPGTLSGTLNMVLALRESNAAADFYTKVFAYITIGDSDASRGTVLDYEESSGGGAAEWGTTQLGKAFLAAQAVGAVNYLEGDRLVIEFGYRAENASTTSRTGSCRTGGLVGPITGIAIEPVADLVVGGTSFSGAGYFVFSGGVNFSASEPTNFNIDSAIDMGTLPYDSGNFPVISSTYNLWWEVTPPADGTISFFPGVSDASGAYVPQVLAYYYDAGAGGFQQYELASVGAIESAINFPFTGGERQVVAVFGNPYLTPPQGAPGRDLRVSASLAPALPAPAGLVAQYLITEDNANVFFDVALATVIDAVTGVVLATPRMIMSENGVANDAGIIALTEFTNPQIAPGLLMLYDTDLSIRAFSNTNMTAGSGAISVCTDGTNFYTAQRRTVAAVNSIWVTKFDQDANVLDSWTIAHAWTAGYAVQACAVSRDGTVFYYGTTHLNRPIYRHDLTNDVALPDFVAADASLQLRDIYVLRDDSILVLWWPDTNSFPLPSFGLIRRYAADGSTIQTYATFSDPFTGEVDYVADRTIIDHIAPTNLDPLNFTAWLQHDISANVYFYFYFVIVNTISGALSQPIIPSATQNVIDGILRPDPDVPTPAIAFGASESCPLIVMGARLTLGSLTIIKETDPNGSGQIFSITVGGGLSPSSFDLTDGQQQDYIDVPPGTYSVEETPVDNWTPSYNVSNGDPVDAIEIGEGESVTVTITNTFGSGPEPCPGVADGLPQDGVEYEWPSN